MNRRAERLAGVAFALAALLLLITALRIQPPSPRSAADAPERFSAELAEQYLKDVVGGGEPRPAGSAAHARAREAIVSRLRSFGYEPLVHRETVCDRIACAEVANIVAVLPGEGKGAVLLASHYDSVAAGPGAGDAATSVAALMEVARIARREPPMRRTVIFLIGDGEEIGLLGAAAFTRSWQAPPIDVVVNLEARGTEGPSLMFETSGFNREMVAHFGAGSPRPLTGSIFDTIYRTLPNDTDLTVFRQRGWRGMNFAFIGGAQRYHTPLDSLQYLDRASLQHHGDQALSMMRRLANAEELGSDADAVFFDLFGFGVVMWSARAGQIAAVLALLIILLAGVVLVRRDRRHLRALPMAIVVLLLALGITGAVVWGLRLWLAASGVLPPGWIARPAPVVAIAWIVPLLGHLAAVFLAGRRVTLEAMWIAVTLLYGSLGLLVAFRVPGLSYPLVLPAVAAAASAGSLLLPRGGGGAAAVLVPLSAAVTLFAPVALLLYDGLGTGALLIIALLMAVATSMFTVPLVECARRFLWTGLLSVGAVLVLLMIVAGLSEPYSNDVPLHLNLTYAMDADAQQARWIARGSELPEPLRREVAFSDEKQRAFPWGSSGWTAPAEEVPLEPPLFEAAVERRGGRVIVDGVLRSRRGARVGAVAVRTAHTPNVRINGVALESDYTRSRSQPGEWSTFSMQTLPPEGARFQIELDAEARELVFWDSTSGLPREGRNLAKARPSWAVPIGRGDSTVVWKRFAIER